MKLLYSFLIPIIYKKIDLMFIVLIAITVLRLI